MHTAIVVFGCLWVLLGQQASPSLEGQAIQLTRDGSFKSNLAWSPDGKKLLFTRIHQGKMELCTMDPVADAKVDPLIQPSPNTPHFDGAWSADSKQVVYVHDILQGTDGKLQINTANADGTGSKVVIPHKAFEESPRFSPDGSQILWVSTRDGNQEIYTWELASGKVSRLTQDPGFDNNPSFRRDGKRVVFCTSRHGNFEIASMNADGADMKRLTNHPAMDIWPSYAPGGKWIAFTSNRTGNYNLFVMDEEGGNLTQVTHNKGVNNFATWAPDGSRIAYISNKNSSYEVYIQPWNPLKK